jgi:hypothetical protein
MANPTGKGGFKENPSNINTGGRTDISFNKLLRLKIDDYVDLKKGNEIVDRKQIKEVIVEKILQMALSGNLRAIEFIWERIEGKSIQPINMGETAPYVLTPEEEERIDRVLNGLYTTRQDTGKNKRKKIKAK